MSCCVAKVGKALFSGTLKKGVNFNNNITCLLNHIIAAKKHNILMRQRRNGSCLSICWSVLNKFCKPNFGSQLQPRPQGLLLYCRMVYRFGHHRHWRMRSVGNMMSVCYYGIEKTALYTWSTGFIVRQYTNPLIAQLYQFLSVTILHKLLLTTIVKI